jgi:hypothetical protein
VNRDIQLQGKLVAVVEQIPLLVFVAIQHLGFGMEARIIIGGVLSIPVLSLLIARKSISSYTFLGVNIFLFVCTLILLSPFNQLSQALLNLGEPVMIAIIILCSLVVIGIKVWQLSIITPIRMPLIFMSGFVFLSIYICCFLISYSFRGNEIIAGAIPVIVLYVSEKGFNYSLDHHFTEVSNARS